VMTALCGLAQNYGQLLLARIGVGAGEAGSNPPSHSIIADLWAPHERATAMAIFATGVNFGVLLGFLVGGWANQFWGWRATFIIVGLPGVVLGLLVLLLVREPQRGAAERAPDASVPVRAPAPPFFDTLRFVMRDRVLVYMMLGGAFTSFVGYANVIWVPVYFMRVHGLESGIVGTGFALIAGLGGAIGVYATGLLADRLGARRAGWRPGVLAVGLLLGIPMLLAMVATANPMLAFALFTLPAILGAFQAGPVFAAIQSRSPPERRAVAASINLFIGNIIGLGAGPWFVGMLSDQLRPTQGADALSIAIGSLVLFYVIAAGLFWRAATLIDREPPSAHPSPAAGHT
ncbi:MAG: spinster family MFS transporter, partial [Gammaproteobacteria bacterium]